MERAVPRIRMLPTSFLTSPVLASHQMRLCPPPITSLPLPATAHMRSAPLSGQPMVLSKLDTQVRHKFHNQSLINKSILIFVMFFCPIVALGQSYIKGYSVKTQYRRFLLLSLVCENALSKSERKTRIIFI